MVTKSHKQNKKETGRIKVGKLKLNKETVQDLTPGKEKGIRGGAAAAETEGWFCAEDRRTETCTCLIVSQCGRCR